MVRSEKLLIVFLLLAALSSIIIVPAQATVTNFTVEGGEEVTKSIRLVVDDHVLIKFTVVGQSDKTLYFYITYPNGSVKEFGKLGTFDYSFVCSLEGEYILHFSNKDSPEDKLVTLDYEVQHYIFGIPQMLFLTIVVVLVCIGAVATFIIMGKPH